ncbi:MAG: helix-turn-helix domain-containing protein [Rhodospirillaceae bacterium]|nr:helix-turn-helix domain-containing protein [Rhodospirillaceae bacterium]
MTKRQLREEPDPVDQHVGKRLKTRRVGLRISQSDIGKKLGVTFQQIQKYENGSNRVGASNLFRLADALEVPVSYFFEDLPKGQAAGFAEDRQDKFSNKDKDVFDPMNEPESIKLVHNYFRIDSPEVRQQVFRLVKSIADDEEKKKL